MEKIKVGDIVNVTDFSYSVFYVKGPGSGPGLDRLRLTCINNCEDKFRVLATALSKENLPTSQFVIEGFRVEKNDTILIHLENKNILITQARFLRPIPVIKYCSHCGQKIERK